MRTATRWSPLPAPITQDSCPHSPKLAPGNPGARFFIRSIPSGISSKNTTARASTFILWSARILFWISRTWKDYETLLGLCDFIVASRPGFNVNALRLVIPPELFGRKGVAHAPLDPRAITLRRTVVYVLDAVSSHVSATEVRMRLDRNESIHGLVPPRVEEYISKKALYR